MEALRKPIRFGETTPLELQIHLGKMEREQGSLGLEASTVLGRMQEMSAKLNGKIDIFSLDLTKAWNEWLKEFNAIRNTLAHHLLTLPSGQIQHKIESQEVNYSRYVLVLKIDGAEINKVLPTYFDEIYHNADNFVNNFYNVLSAMNWGK